MTSRQPATPTVQVDNDEVIITRWDFAPDEETGHHTHRHDYVVVPLTTGTLRITDVDGSVTDSNLKAGHSYFRKAGVSHNVVNASDHAFSFIEIELK